MTFFNSIKEFIYPNISVITEEKITEDSKSKYWNNSELKLLERLTDENRNKIKSKINCNHFYSSLEFSDNNYTQKLIHTIKYNGFRKLGIETGRYFGDDFSQYITSQKINLDFLIPVPLHPVKERERGFNQSLEIAKGLTDKIQIELNDKIIRRIKNTKTQTRLSAEERKQNVQNAFKIVDSFLGLIEGKNILLLDDVVTTGSTLNEIISLLKKNKVKEICVYTISSVIN